MGEVASAAKFLIITGIVLIIVGLAVFFMGKMPHIGRLPGDILVKKDNFTFYFPIVTSVVISIILTIILNLFFRK